MLNLQTLDILLQQILADYLVKNHSMSFRKAYQKTAAIVNLAEKKKKKLNELTLKN
jgi:argininosuccinate lyase